MRHTSTACCVDALICGGAERLWRREAIALCPAHVFIAAVARSSGLELKTLTLVTAAHAVALHRAESLWRGCLRDTHVFDTDAVPPLVDAFARLWRRRHAFMVVGRAENPRNTMSEISLIHFVGARMA